ncbi:MBL fold metallo-hydrolase [Nocardioides perillae]|uniref:Glyoxylase-like metal-dependent hydrolase (Beta-lactamase superfamily II) n=1 Tax=Nocardioides perillae TaxID=1119534 RepID=A0A7Y9UML0_9ACTN|nr:glyoxylase-like metal-dependent hydrolase (beta-lactamase superfamily II) [Nocardioides perillae]
MSRTEDFREVADRVWHARRSWCDVGVVLVGGEAGLVLVDPHGSAAAGRAVVEDVRRLGVGEVTAVVTTHWHVDHTFGTVAVTDAYGAVPVHAHEVAADELAAGADRLKARYATDPGDPHRDDVLATEVVLPTHTFSSATVLDLGDRVLELVHPGRGHTAGDLVVRVPDADVLLAGDLVEESGHPAYGEDCWPLEWPRALDLVIGLLTPQTVVLPGHGAPVGLDFVQEQRAAIGVVAETVRDAAGRGVPVSQALASASWPYPAEALEHAVRRGYEHLPRSQKRLPLL